MLTFKTTSNADWLTNWLAGWLAVRWVRQMEDKESRTSHPHKKIGNCSSPLLHLPTPTFYGLWMSSVQHRSQISLRPTELDPPLLYVWSPIPLPTPTSVFTVSQSTQSFESVDVGHSVISFRRCLWKNVLYSTVACDLLHIYQIWSSTFPLEQELKLISVLADSWAVPEVLTWLVCDVIERLTLNYQYNQMISVSVCHSEWVRRE